MESTAPGGVAENEAFPGTNRIFETHGSSLLAQAAVHISAFTAPDHMGRDAFERRWSRLRADETVLARVIDVDDDAPEPSGRY